MTDEHQIDGTTVAEKLANTDIAGYFDVVTINNSPSDPTDAATKDYVDSSQAGLDWQESVISQQNTPPASPSTGDRYLVGTSPTGDWVGHPNEIAEWDGSAWDFTVPDEGFAVFVEDTNSPLVYDGSSWVAFGSIIDHGALGGLSDDDHTQYLLVDGTRAMSGALDMGTNAISNASNGTFSGTVSASTTDTNAVENKDYNESVNSIANATGTTDIDLSLANMHEVEADGDITITFSNVTGTPPGNSLLVRIYDDDASGPHSITWPASVEWSQGTSYTSVDASGELEIALRSYDGGTTWKASRGGENFA